MVRGEPALVIQIGSASGREIGWLAARHDRHRFLGIDPVEATVEYARSAHRYRNLTFEAASAEDIPRLVGSTGRALIVSSGSLTYVQPEHIRALLERLGRRPGLRIVLCEPAQWDPNLDDSR